MATVPNPVTWDDDNNDEVPTASDLNTEIRDTVNFLVNPQWVMVRDSANQDITPDTWTVIDWNTTVDETEDQHNPASNSGRRLVAKTAGWYEVHLVLRWEWHTFPTGPRAIMIRKNSEGTVGGTELATDRRRASEHIGTQRGISSMSCTAYVDLAVDDYVEAYCLQGQANAIVGTVNSEIYHDPPSEAVSDVRFFMVWIHP
jgi:hypothetical protein